MDEQKPLLKDWRPKDWEHIKNELATKPAVWSPAGPNLTYQEQLVEATASRILEEYQKGEASANIN